MLLGKAIARLRSLQAGRVGHKQGKERLAGYTSRQSGSSWAHLMLVLASSYIRRAEAQPPIIWLTMFSLASLVLHVTSLLITGGQGPFLGPWNPVPETSAM